MFLYKDKLAREKDEESRKRKVCLLLIDPQSDFCNPNGSLSVAGADRDCLRLAQAMKRHIMSIDQIFVTLDTHQQLHIAHGLFWVDSLGKHPAPFTVITSEDLKAGKWKASLNQYQHWAEEYVEHLEKGGRFKLVVWPNHCLIGTKGHAVMDIVKDAILEWENVNNSAAHFVIKGNNAFTEHYSAFKAEVLIKDDAQSGLNQQLIDTLNEFDRIFIAGQALSHCVNFSVRDLVDHLSLEDRKKVEIIEDACSSVSGFEQQGMDFVNDMKKLGITFTTSAKAFQ